MGQMARYISQNKILKKSCKINPDASFPFIWEVYKINNNLTVIIRFNNYNNSVIWISDTLFCEI